MPVRKTGALPEPIDRQVNEIIRAFSEMEEQVKQIRKALDPRIGDNAEYIDRHVRNLNNPHSVTAKQVKALPLAFVLDPSSIYFPFQNSLVSTRGETPIGLYGSSITDYGLVTGNDLCATLLPEGGVAVTEGTENLVTNPTEWKPNNNEYQKVEDTGETYLGCKISKTTKLTGSTHPTHLISLSIADGETYTASIYQKCLYNAGEDFAGRLIFYDAAASNTLASVETEKIGEWERLKITYTNNTGATLNDVRVFYYPAKTQGSITLTAAPQVEKKPYDTPFVEGTRPVGSLSYDLPISINCDWTIAKWMELEPYFMDKTLTGDNPIDKYRLPLLELGEKYYTEGYGVIGVYGAWEPNRPGNTINIMANKDTDRVYSSMPDTITLTEAEYNNKILAVLTKSGSMLTAYIYTVGNKYVLTCNIASLGDISQITPRLNYHTVTTGTRKMYSKRHLNTLVCPYAVSPETIATWHSLDAPFIDPFVPPSQGVPYFNTPDEFINSTANFAMVNVDGLVKLYARTPDETIIIETSGNTEVV